MEPKPSLSAAKSSVYEPRHSEAAMIAFSCSDCCARHARFSIGDATPCTEPDDELASLTVAARRM